MFFLKKCPTGEHLVIHQAKNVVFVQFQMAFMHYVIEYQITREFDSANGDVFSDGSANISAFCFQQQCGFRSHAALIFIRACKSSEVILLQPADRNFPLADHFNRKQNFLQQEVVAAEALLPIGSLVLRVSVLFLRKL